jgi:hypothetical protein
MEEQPTLPIFGNLYEFTFKFYTIWYHSAGMIEPGDSQQI